LRQRGAGEKQINPMPHCRNDIYVTHDSADADALAARLVQMEANRIVWD
jgi:hypothetical protein